MLTKCRNICEDSCFREGKKSLFLCFYSSYMTWYFSIKISFWTYIGGSFSLGVMISGPCLGLLLVATTIVSRSMTNHTVTSGNNSSSLVVRMLIHLYESSLFSLFCTDFYHGSKVQFWSSESVSKFRLCFARNKNMRNKLHPKNSKNLWKNLRKYQENSQDTIKQNTWTSSFKMPSQVWYQLLNVQ